MRGREFTMKDAYSFDRDEAGALKSYDNMFNAYKRIFTALGLKFRAIKHGASANSILAAYSESGLGSK